VLGKQKVLIVGAFPKTKSNIIGGFLTVCNALRFSSFAEKFELLLIDTTQKSNPAPNLLIRGIFSGKRVIQFLFKVLLYRPRVAIIFCSSGLSLLEKGLMGRFTGICGIPTILVPSGGQLLKDFHQSFALQLFAKIAFKKTDKILCQGKEWQEFLSSNFKRNIDDLPIVGNWTATGKLLDVGKSRAYRKKVGKLDPLFVGWLVRPKGFIGSTTS